MMLHISLDAPEWSACDADGIARAQERVRHKRRTLSADTHRVDLVIVQRRRASAVPHKIDDACSLKNRKPFVGLQTNEDIAWEHGVLDLTLNPVLPTSYGRI